MTVLKQILDAFLAAIKAKAPTWLQAASGVLSWLASVLTASRAAFGMMGSGAVLVFASRFTPVALFAAKCAFLTCAAAYVLHRLKGDDS